MSRVFDAFGRAMVQCLHPRVFLWSLLPLLSIGAAVLLMGWAYWGPAVDAVYGALQRWSLVEAMLGWLDAVGQNSLRALIAPLILVALSVPVVVVLTLLLVAVTVTPVVVRMVAERRFPTMERQRGGTWAGGLAWSLTCTVAAMAALVLSIPLWFVPPLVLLLPPLIWGWLTCRVFGYDVLAEHASAGERRHLLRAHRWPLLAIGVGCGTLSALPSLLWAVSGLALILAPVLVVVSVWLYTLVFAFAACWFAHYLLAALHELRAAAPAPPPAGNVLEASA